MVPQGMTKPAIDRGLQPQLHHVEASEFSVRPTLTQIRHSQCLLLDTVTAAKQRCACVTDERLYHVALYDRDMHFPAPGSGVTLGKFQGSASRKRTASSPEGDPNPPRANN